MRAFQRAFQNCTFAPSIPFGIPFEFEGAEDGHIHVKFDRDIVT